VTLERHEYVEQHVRTRHNLQERHNRWNALPQSGRQRVRTEEEKTTKEKAEKKNSRATLVVFCLSLVSSAFPIPSSPIHARLFSSSQVC
jgi:hypothetical protein